MDLFSESGGSSGSSSRSSSPRIDIIESRSNDHTDFAVNEEYAARFQHNKEREELQRLQEKHGDEGDDEISSSEDETEDEEGEQMTADVDAAILTTLAKIRRKDESIYEAGKRVFDEERKVASQSELLPRLLSNGRDGKKKVTLGQYQRERMQELMKTSDDPARALAEVTMIERRDDIDYRHVQDEGYRNGALPFSREQEELRKEVTNAFHSVGEGDDEDFLVKHEGEADDVEAQDPESYRKYLLSVIGGEDEEKAVREILRSQAEEAAAGDIPVPARGKAPNVRVDDGTEQENEEFLMNYVLNRGWVDNPQAAPKVRRAKREGKQEEAEVEDGFSDMDSEDSFDSRAEAFENAYNFRFEELEGGEAEAQIQSYARNPIGSVRRSEDKRKKEREERAKRKEAEKEAKRKEINRVRDLKRKAIVDRLKKLKEATGSSNIDFERFALDDEFDPDAHDRLMQGAFDDDYYGEEEDLKKPVFDDDLDLDNVIPAKSKKSKSKRSAEIEMDADHIEDDGPSEKKLSKAEKKKLKKREKAKARKQEDKEEEVEVEQDEMDAEEIERMQRLDPVEKKRKMEQVMDEYYGLEYEDMIGDQPTRFKYTPVAKSNFGLTAEEILLADDDDLKGVVSLKRLQPYRDGRRKPSDLNARVKEFRRKQQQRLAKEQGIVEEEEKSKTKRMGKKERQRRKEAAEKAAQAGQIGVAEGTSNKRPKVSS